MTVDISPEMLEIYERKARARGFEPETQVAEIEAFLRDDFREWDLIVFSSALHHLENYRRTLDLAGTRLAVGGLLVTMFDPTPVGRLGKRLRRLDYLAHVLAKTPRRALQLVAQRVSRARRNSFSERACGNRAERHALEGIDDLALRSRFEHAGLQVLVHDRSYEGRFRGTRVLYRALRRPSSFHFIVRRPAREAAPDNAARR